MHFLLRVRSCIPRCMLHVGMQADLYTRLAPPRRQDKSSLVVAGECIPAPLFSPALPRLSWAAACLPACLPACRREPDIVLSLRKKRSDAVSRARVLTPITGQKQSDKVCWLVNLARMHAYRFLSLKSGERVAHDMHATLAKKYVCAHVSKVEVPKFAGRHTAMDTRPPNKK